MGSDINKTPKRHVLGRKDAMWRINRQNRSNSATYARDEETKKDTERNPTVANWLFACRPPTLSQCHVDLRVLSHPGSSYIFQASSKSVQGFWSHGMSTFALSHWLGQWLIQCTVQAVIISVSGNCRALRCNFVGLCVNMGLWRPAIGWSRTFASSKFASWRHRRDQTNDQIKCCQFCCCCIICTMGVCTVVGEQ